MKAEEVAAVVDSMAGAEPQAHQLEGATLINM